jgi:uncharacterized protein (TIGR02453 family)
MMREPGFAGMPAEGIEFLANLAGHNERAWFEAHRGEYETFVRRPMWGLVDALAPAMLKIDPEFDIGSRGPAVSRIHRDTRFTRDKAPYRVNQWIAFRRRAEDWTDRPCFFMEFRADGWSYGMGYYSATATTMKAIRAHIVSHTKAFLAATAAARGHGFGVEGETYRRPVACALREAEVRQWFGLRNAHLVRNRPLDQVFFGAGLAGELERGFGAAAPLYRFLVAAGRA